MTMPEERAASVLRTREFLKEVSHSRDARIPEEIRLRARTLLRHFPDEGDIAMVCSALPDWWQSPSRRGHS
jgi:hypothetical protein